MAEQPEVVMPTGAGRVYVEKVTFPYRAVALKFLLENIGEVRIPLPTDEARRLGEAMIAYADELSAGGDGAQN
jgi:hypothetical protein